jgi:hypothetical protein
MQHNPQATSCRTSLVSGANANFLMGLAAFSLVQRSGSTVRGRGALKRYCDLAALDARRLDRGGTGVDEAIEILTRKASGRDGSAYIFIMSMILAASTLPFGVSV